MQLLAEHTAQQLVYSNLAREIQVPVDTIKRWIDLLGRMHYGFTVRPWFTNVAKALRKEPKWFLRDWGGVSDDGIEVKLSDTNLSPALAHFQAQTKAPHAFQAVMTLPYEPADCFGVRRPVIVPAKTLLSQLL